MADVAFGPDMIRHGKHPDLDAHWWQKSPTTGIVVGWSVLLALAALLGARGA